MSDGSRVGLTMTKMTEEEAKDLNVPIADRKSFVRMDDAKANLAPEAAKARWFKLIGVSLGNSDQTYPNGDFVQAIEHWDAPTSAFDGLSVPELNAVLDGIEEGPEKGQRYTLTKRGGSQRWAGNVLMRELKRTEKRANIILKTWIENGTLEEREYTNTKRRMPEFGLFVVAAERQGTEVVA